MSQAAIDWSGVPRGDQPGLPGNTYPLHAFCNDYNDAPPGYVNQVHDYPTFCRYMQSTPYTGVLAFVRPSGHQLPGLHTVLAAFLPFLRMLFHHYEQVSGSSLRLLLLSPQSGVPDTVMHTSFHGNGGLVFLHRPSAHDDTTLTPNTTDHASDHGYPEYFWPASQMIRFPWSGPDPSTHQLVLAPAEPPLSLDAIINWLHATWAQAIGQSPFDLNRMLSLRPQQLQAVSLLVEPYQRVQTNFWLCGEINSRLRAQLCKECGINGNEQRFVTREIKEFHSRLFNLDMSVTPAELSASLVKYERFLSLWPERFRAHQAESAAKTAAAGTKRAQGSQQQGNKGNKQKREHHAESASVSLSPPEAPSPLDSESDLAPLTVSQRHQINTILSAWDELARNLMFGQFADAKASFIAARLSIFRWKVKARSDSTNDAVMSHEGVFSGSSERVCSAIEADASEAATLAASSTCSATHSRTPAADSEGDADAQPVAAVAPDYRWCMLIEHVANRPGVNGLEIQRAASGDGVIASLRQSPNQVLPVPIKNSDTLEDRYERAAENERALSIVLRGRKFRVPQSDVGWHAERGVSALNNDLTFEDTITALANDGVMGPLLFATNTELNQCLDLNDAIGPQEGIVTASGAAVHAHLHTSSSTSTSSSSSSSLFSTAASSSLSCSISPLLQLCSWHHIDTFGCLRDKTLLPSALRTFETLAEVVVRGEPRLFELRKRLGQLEPDNINGDNFSI